MTLDNYGVPKSLKNIVYDRFGMIFAAQSVDQVIWGVSHNAQGTLASGCP